MYYAHFGLNEAPFKITPNTECFFTGNNRGAVLDALIYAITSGEGIVKVVGEVGSGKTMLCRMLQSQLPDTVECVYLANPSVAPEDILHAIAFELDLKLPRNPDKLKVMQALQQYLLERHESGKQVVIFVEEAQGMPLATLEEIRLLSNLETKHDKLLQMVLFGQPELDSNLNQTHIRQLRERITHSFHLPPLNVEEVGEYLVFRLRSSGYYGPPIFTEKSVANITQAAEGLIRRVNILADKAMLAAFADNLHQVSPKHVKVAIQDSEFGVEQAKASKKKVRFFSTLSVLLLTGLLGLGLLVMKMQPPWLSHVTSLLGLGNAKVDIRPSSQPMPKSVTSATNKSPKTVSTVKKAVAQVVKQPSELTKDKVAVDLGVATSSSYGDTVEEVVTGHQSSEVLAEEPSVPVTTFTDNIDQRMQATERWLNTSGNHTVTIQVLSAPKDTLEAQLRDLVTVLELDKVYIYPAMVNQRRYHRVLYGSFADKVAASKALKQLPDSIQKNGPHLRTVGGILAETSNSL